MTHVEKANQYIVQVLDGTIPACRLTKLACQRQVDDLAREDWEWQFDEAAAERVSKFIELSPQVKGKKFAGKPLILEPWQCFVITTLFGWVSKYTGLRRFKKGYAEVSKGNGKSPLMAALANYMAFAEGEPGAEVYSAAAARQQARVVFDTSQAMLRKMTGFTGKAGIEVREHCIIQQKSNSTYRPLSKEAKLAEGALPYFTVVDELHVHPDRDLFDNLSTANEKRDNSMLLAITTAGSDRAGICFEQHLYVEKILSRVVYDESYFACVWTVDADDDPWNEITWRKANPNWGVSVNPVSIRAEANRAKQLPSAQAAFLTKHLDVWVSADSAWMDMLKFQKCADPRLKEGDFVSVPCVIGLDLASKLDIAAKVDLYVERRDSKWHYTAFLQCWTPEARIEESSNSQYKGWAAEGFLTACEGETNDYDLIEDAIRQDCKTRKVLEIAHDPYQAVELVNHLAKGAISCVEVSQVVKYLSEPMKELEAAVADGRFHFDGNPVLAWAMSNVVAHRDRNDCLFPNKQHAESKIDPATALLTGLNRAMALAATNQLAPEEKEYITVF